MAPPAELLKRKEARAVRDARWQELTKECFKLLAGRHLGRVVLVDERGPLALPVNSLVDQHRAVFVPTRERALAAMLVRYLECSASDQPVHTWPTGRTPRPIWHRADLHPRREGSS
jgi:hypothetical protein